MSHKVTSPSRRLGPTRATTEASIEKQQAALDARSIVALEWVTHWLQRHASVKVAPAVVVRRALFLLADHLSNLGPQLVAREGHLIRDAAKGSGSAISLTEARARLERHVETYRGPGAPGPQPMAHWRDMLHSIEDRKQSKQMLDKLEAMMAERFPEEVLP